MRYKFIRPINEQHQYKDDIDRLVKIAKDFDYYLSEADAIWAWQDYSYDVAASWLIMDRYTDSELFNILNNKLEYECNDI